MHRPWREAHPRVGDEYPLGSQPRQPACGQVDCVLEHAPDANKEEAPLILVGKGVTFGTGGISVEARRQHVVDEA